MGSCSAPTTILKVEQTDSHATVNDKVTGDNAPKVDPMSIGDLLQQTAVVLAGGFALLANPPKSINYLALYKIYLLFLLFSFVPCIVLLFVPKSPTDPRVRRIQKQVTNIASVSIFLSAIPRVFLELPRPITWYDVVTPLLVAVSTVLYLGHDWVKAKNTGQRLSVVVATANDV